MRVLVTGAGGQVGREVVERFETCAEHTVIAADHTALDCGDRDAVVQCIAASAPDAIVHCAAYTAVDECELDPDRAFRDNALAVRHLVDGATHGSAYLLVLSTDYVFDGTKADPYTEWDLPSPQSVYGRSKLGGERELERATTPWAVLRTSWVCGQYGNNMLKTAMRLLDGNGRLRFVHDQVGHPTFAADLAVMIERFVVARRTGLHHVTNQGAVSWFEFVQAVARATDHDPGRVEPISTADLDPPRPAPRPANSVLDNAALRLGGVELLPDFHDALARCISQIRPT